VTPGWSLDAQRLLPRGEPFAVSAMVTALKRARTEEARDELLKRVLVSVDAPTPDRTYIHCSDGTALTSLPQQLSAAVDIVTSTEGRFDVTPSEAFQHVLSIYTVDWSNMMPHAPTIRAGFMTDTRANQQWFLSEFLDLYDRGSDVSALPGADKAARWLRSRQRYLAHHTLVLHARPTPTLDEVKREVSENVNAVWWQRAQQPMLQELMERMGLTPTDQQWFLLASAGETDLFPPPAMESARKFGW
jgi:hypothetical protein